MLLSTIYRVPLVGIHRAKSESSSIRRGRRVSTKKGELSPKIQRRRLREINDFRLGRLPTRATVLQEVGILPTLVYSYFCGLIST